MTKKHSKHELNFKLDVGEDGWPPVATECMPVDKVGDQKFKILVPPLFVKGLSVGDIVTPLTKFNGCVETFSIVEKSNRTMIWMLRGKAESIEDILSGLLKVDCNVARFEQFGHYAIDVPETVPESELDKFTDAARAAGAYVAVPSFRYPDLD